MWQVVPESRCVAKIPTSQKLKNILKPVLRKIFKINSSSSSNRRKAKASKKKSAEATIAKIEQNFDFEWMSETSDNDANEDLEQRLIEDIQNSPTDAAIFIFDEDGSKRLQQIDPHKFYIPVHFARTNAGTFFWTSVQKSEPLKIEWTFLDRWAQA